MAETGRDRDGERVELNETFGITNVGGLGLLTQVHYESQEHTLKRT